MLKLLLKSLAISMNSALACYSFQQWIGTYQIRFQPFHQQYLNFACNLNKIPEVCDSLRYSLSLVVDWSRTRITSMGTFHAKDFLRVH
jgi:hypothetical protein